MDLKTTISNLSQKIIYKQMDLNSLLRRKLLFKKSEKIKNITQEIQDYTAQKNILETLYNQLKAGTVSFNSFDLKFPLNQSLLEQGFYLIERKQLNNQWVWTYKID